MKIILKKYFKVFALFVVVLMLSVPVVTLAQRDIHLEARVAAERDAETDTSQLLWIGGNFCLAAVGGCLLGSVGLLGAIIYDPPVPSYRLLGKSPEYVMFYTQAYKEKVENLQLRSSFLGCLGGTVVAVIIWTPYYSR
ncbi:MAG: hypothetical protein OXP71_04900 [Candidatus Poribacteria bacterium]|nr:hypothetical protein [Candidatus Poribacteria bacterium]